MCFIELWKFIAPGLYKNEQSLWPGVCRGYRRVCFIGGAVFCYYLVLPIAFDFFLGYSTTELAEVTYQLNGQDVTQKVGVAANTHYRSSYLSLERKLLIGFGLVFELPLIIFFLVAGRHAVTHRGLWRVQSLVDRDLVSPGRRAHTT